MATSPAPISGPAPDAHDPEAEPLEEVPAQPYLTFWQKPWVQNLLPLLTSISVHLAIIIVALLIGGAVQQMGKLVVQEQIVVPDASFTDGPVGGIPNPGLGGDPNRAAAQDQFKDVNSSDGMADKPSQSLTASLMGGGSGDSAEMSQIGLGASTGAGKGSGVGKGEGLGSGSGDGGPLAMWGMPGGGGGVGPKFLGQGTGGNTRSIAFVCDASGSMMQKGQTLKDELKRTVDQLRSVQAFSIIFFADQKPRALSAELLMASPENKRRAYGFLQEVSFAGQTKPVPALELAFRQHPQLIFLLTDGDFPDGNQEVIDCVRRLNKDNSVKINTIAFLGQGDNDKEFIEVLSQIAKENHGVFAKVSQDDIR